MEIGELQEWFGVDSEGQPKHRGREEERRITRQCYSAAESVNRLLPEGLIKQRALAHIFNGMKTAHTGVGPPELTKDGYANPKIFDMDHKGLLTARERLLSAAHRVIGHFIHDELPGPNTEADTELADERLVETARALVEAVDGAK